MRWPASCVLCDQTIVLTEFYAATNYPARFWCIALFDAETSKRFVSLSNSVDEPAFTIDWLFKAHWQVENFLELDRQQLQIKTLYGTLESKVKTQVWLAVFVMLFEKSTYFLQAFSPQIASPEITEICM